MNRHSCRPWPVLMLMIAIGGLACPIVAVAGDGATQTSTDWPRWRGPNGNSVIQQTTPWSAKWGDDGPRQLWSVPVGIGYASISVSEHRCYTTGHRDGRDIVYCLNADTGKTIWQQAYAQDILAKWNPGGPNATPTVDGRWLYVLGKEGTVSCFDKASGKLRWRREVHKRDGLPLPLWGYASTPIIVGQRLFLNVGESGVALDKDNGELLWKSAAEPCGYACPVPFEWNGQPSLVMFGHHAVHVVRQSDGKQLWQTPWPTKMGENSADPIVVGNLLYVSSW
ncbi:MAG: PQQ-like beta-propeller repeat protein, partial [Pirellulaceae bacterium]|nr:PQQ-like beta-propeller repeat protein [Pirellulaceae bacterium]